MGIWVVCGSAVMGNEEEGKEEKWRYKREGFDCEERLDEEGNKNPNVKHTYRAYTLILKSPIPHFTHKTALSSFFKMLSTRLLKYKYNIFLELCLCKYYLLWPYFDRLCIAIRFTIFIPLFRQPHNFHTIDYFSLLCIVVSLTISTSLSVLTRIAFSLTVLISL